MPKAAKPRISPSGQRALIIGVSDYPNPINRLPAVAADAREMASILSSKHGVFPADGITVLTDTQATCAKVIESLRDIFENASATDTIFVYLAGHGVESDGSYYFVAYDSKNSETSVPLSEIKSLFDATRSRRAFLWLDFCHSGGILARGSTPDDMTTVKRAIGVVRGEGKVIVAACTRSQSSYESSELGHGFFTHALLRGLKGEAKSAQGEVTAHSLYEFIDHQVGSHRQQPVFFGETIGRIVLAYYPERGKVEAGEANPKPALVQPQPDDGGTWVLLGEHVFNADRVRYGAEDRIEITATSTNGDESAMFSGFRSDRFGSRGIVPFAEGVEAHFVQVQSATSESANGKQVWTLNLKIDDRSIGNDIGMTYILNDRKYTPDDLARLRAGRVLLNDPAPTPGQRRDLSFNSIESYIAGGGSHPVNECVIRSVFRTYGQDSKWQAIARLKAIFQLKASGVVHHIFELAIGNVEMGGVRITFRGQRNPHYAGTPPTTIEIDGICPISN